MNLISGQVVLSLNSSATAALAWWLIPFFAVTGAIIYVIWVSKFQSKYENQTERSVNKFQSFQESFRPPSSNGVAEDSIPDEN